MVLCRIDVKGGNRSTQFSEKAGLGNGTFRQGTAGCLGRSFTGRGDGAGLSYVPLDMVCFLKCVLLVVTPINKTVLLANSL